MTYKPSSSSPSRSGGAFFPYLLALRPHHWTKNLIIFAAPLFNFDFSSAILFNSLLAFGLFCGLSSSFYLFNDIVDVEADRRHPVKCNRPIASGAVPVAVAFCMAISLLVGTLFIGLMSSPLLGLTLVAYAALQVAYNLRLKRLVLLDIITISTGFVLRACAGAAATGIDLSAWFLVCTAMLALFLAIEKRKAELRRGGSTRSVLKRYSLSLLLRLENIATTGTLMSYAIWSVGSQLGGATTPWMLLTFPFVLYGVFRYQLLSDPVETWQNGPGEPAAIEHTERPEKVLLTDRPLLLTVACWGITALTILLLEQQGLIQ
ncbi:MAG: decaprenyl-phosphate phosphoribosyltransferase [Phormidesmis sp.]